MQCLDLLASFLLPLAQNSALLLRQILESGLDDIVGGDVHPCGIHHIRWAGASMQPYRCTSQSYGDNKFGSFAFDNPGVFSCEKQRIECSSDFTGITSWFADKSDLILLFDPQKLDISDEFKRVIASLCRHHKKSVVLNKADQVDTQLV